MTDSKTNIVFRCDGNAEIGLGHLYRCIALAEFLKEDFSIHFVTRPESEMNIIPSDYAHFKIDSSITFAKEPDFIIKNFDTRCTIIVVDGYNFDITYLDALNGVFKIVYIDDLHSFYLSVDLIINHSGGIVESDFETLPLTRFCLGPDYAILRKPFLITKTPLDFEYDILICFGGADPQNLTTKICADFDSTKKIAVVLGSAYLFKKELLEKITDNILVFENLNGDKLADVMKRSKAAITSSSTVAYEFLSVSSGLLYILKTAENQHLLYDYLIDVGAARKYTGDIEENWKTTRLIDGNSPKRILKEFRLLELELYSHIRRVNEKDENLVFEWVNDPEVRSQSYDQNPISIEKHRQWFSKIVVDPEVFYYIVYNDQKEIGQIRFSLNNTTATIGYLIDKNFRNKGWGAVLLKKGVLQLQRDVSNIRKIVGYVKQSNLASQRSFLRCNFKQENTKDYPDSFVYTLDL